ncbi:hypothetical protein PR202_gb03409 [Eleusine coracana subsp. coracana]|uniref:Uncharacterized protein n=1 Tax=Eleusine coracana subsp. coracana TaxID=191504 RepID=A0AAV5DZD3_ELECO|nr:hypothetical protein PR202_gb03409 [Eleusine coracana subsp. coracana]
MYVVPAATFNLGIGGSRSHGLRSGFSPRWTAPTLGEENGACTDGRWIDEAISKIQGVLTMILRPVALVMDMARETTFRKKHLAIIDPASGAHNSRFIWLVVGWIRIPHTNVWTPQFHLYTAP